MRSILRSLTFGLATMLGVAAMAQQPYTIVVYGVIDGCYPGQTVNVQTIQGTQPSYNFDVTVGANCDWNATLDVASNPAWFMVSTQCNGVIVTAWDSVIFNFFPDSATVLMTLDCGGGGQVDCLGTPGGGALPGTPCDDGDPNTTDDSWSANCECVGNPLGNGYDCLGILNGPNQPGTWCVTFLGDTGLWSPDCICTTNSNVNDCMGVPNGPDQPGTACTIPGTTIEGIWTVDCVCDPDSNSTWIDCNGVLNGPNMPWTPCFVLNQPGTWNADCECILNGPNNDCLGIPNGPNMPGTACDDGDPNTSNDTWSANCQCVGNPLGNGYDCLGIFNGPNQPGTLCITFLGDTGVWSPDCICLTNSNNTDCLGIVNGPNMPGTACTDTVNGAIITGTWSPTCVCSPNAPCEASFWVLQAYGQDSLPIPFELWVWNLSSGGNGVLSHFWDFGDGTTSTDAFPTHTYADNGPYVLCLTIADNNGCTDTYCDTVSINEDGIYEGMVGNGGDRSEGFTINVQNPLANAVQEVTTTGSIATWPNPAVDELNVAVVSGMTGAVEVSITDLDGRVVISERMSFSGGRKQLSLSTSELGAGMYLLRISDGATILSQRFVKAN